MPVPGSSFNWHICHASSPPLPNSVLFMVQSFKKCLCFYEIPIKKSCYRVLTLVSCRFYPVASNTQRKNHSSMLKQTFGAATISLSKTAQKVPVNLTLFLNQSAIGWNLFLHGYLTPLWDLLPCSNSTRRTKMLTLIYADLRLIW